MSHRHAVAPYSTRLICNSGAFAGALASTLKVYSGIRFEKNATDSTRNLSKREADIAIRCVQPQQKELIAQRVTWFDPGWYAGQRHPSQRFGAIDSIDPIAHTT